jgi:GTP:adenosylcobinamide-phosphate guanylyltransferase
MDIQRAEHPPKYPVFVMCGEDPKRRKLMEAIDPDKKYKSKALLPFLGRRLVDWQMDELRKSPYVGELYIIGLDENDLPFDFPTHYVPVETISDFGEKLIRGLDYLEASGENPDLIIISSCDAPAIRVEDINAFFEQIQTKEGGEVYISIVPEGVAEAVFPKSGRVVARFKDWQVFPGELYALSPRAIRIQQQVISDLGLLRLKINRQDPKISLGPMLGYLAKRPRTWWTLLKFVMGQAMLADGEKMLTNAFGCKTQGIIIEDAGFGMDMDIPGDYERLISYVKKTKFIGHRS